jgi:cell division protein FtsL
VRAGARASARPERGALDTLLRVADHGLLDRLIRGRLWIALIAFSLIGIVAMQLVVLRLNTEIGRGLERKSTLQREVSALQVSNSSLSAGDRVQAEAQRLGMQVAPQQEATFLGVQSSDARGAAALLSGGAASGAGGQSNPNAGGASASGPSASSTSTASEGVSPSGQSAQAAAGNTPASPGTQEGAQAPASTAVTPGAQEDAPSPPGGTSAPSGSQEATQASGQQQAGASGTPQAGSGTSAEHENPQVPAAQEGAQG